MIFKLVHPTTGTVLGVYTTRRAARAASSRCDFPVEVVEVEAMVPRGVTCDKRHGGTCDDPSCYHAGGTYQTSLPIPSACPKCGGRLSKMLPTPNAVRRFKCPTCDMIYKEV